MLNRNRFTQERLDGTWLDRLWVFLFLGLALVLAILLFPRIFDRPWLLAAAFGTGWVLSDFISGMVHWAGDTWGTADFPFFGPRFIRPFREHHVDPKSITLHDFFDVNGTNCAICLPLLVGAILARPSHAGTGGLFAATVAWSLSFWTFATNQIHKWAHEDAPLAWVRGLQKLWIILPTSEHEKHHKAPYANYYSITTGWLNPLFARIGFYRAAEIAIRRLTGNVPRREELT